MTIMYIRTYELRQPKDVEEVNQFLKEFANYIIDEEKKILKEIFDVAKGFLHSKK